MTISLETLLSENTFETYFVQIIIKIKADYNFSEIYNQIRGVKDVVVLRVKENERLDGISSQDSKYSLLEMKFISEGNPVETLKQIRHESLKIPGIRKFYTRNNTMIKIRNY